MISIVSFILWIAILFFSVTVAYSIMNLEVKIGEAQMLPSSKGISFSFPFFINNNGYYEITDMNLTTRVTDFNGTMVDQTETIVQSIPKGTVVNSSHIINIDLEHIMSMDHVSLLLKDNEFNVEISTSLNFAQMVPVKLSMNTTIPWEAPFAGFSVGEMIVSLYNDTHVEAKIPIRFENHAVLDISGTLKLEFYNSSQERIASGSMVISVRSHSTYNNNISMYAMQEDAPKLIGGRNLHLIFETLMFTVDWWVPYG